MIVMVMVMVMKVAFRFSLFQQFVVFLSLLIFFECQNDRSVVNSIRNHSTSMIKGSSSLLRNHHNHLSYSFPAKNSSCQLKHVHSNQQLVDTYWINLETSIDRRQLMQSYLQYYGMSNNYRIRAVTPAQIVLAPGMNKPQKCIFLNDQQIMSEALKIKEKQENLSSSLSSSISNTIMQGKHRHHLSHHSQSQLHPSINKTILMSGLCGRPKNSLKELAVTLSHLSAIHKSIVNHLHHPQEYILILEDDLQFAIEIDFQELIATAPKDFIILQLITSNFYIIDMLFFKNYINKKIFWLPRKEKDDFWCAGAYLIHKKRFLQLFPSSSSSSSSITPPSLSSSRLKTIHENNGGVKNSIYQKYSDRLFIANIVAGYQRPNCVPRECCNTTTNKLFSNYQNASTFCIRSPRGFQADNYIFALAEENTYLLTIPLLVNTKVGNRSTLHQDHVEIHQLAFNRTKELIKEMFIGGKYPIPSFVNVNCMLNFSSEVLL